MPTNYKYFKNRPEIKLKVSSYTCNQRIVQDLQYMVPNLSLREHEIICQIIMHNHFEK